MRDQKNIDRLFQESLKDFEVFPPNNAWNKIDKQLVVVPKKRRFPVWAKLASIAALLLLFFTVGTVYFAPTNNFSKAILAEFKNDKNAIVEKEPTNTITAKQKETTAKKNVSVEEKSNIQENIITNTKSIVSIDTNDEKISKTNSQENTITKKSSNDFSLIDTENLPLTTSKKETIKKDVSDSKFTVATIFAPIYFNSFGSGSGIDSQFKDNTSSDGSSYSYGVKLAYKLNNKFSLQSGVNLINLGYKTNNVYITPGVAVIGFSDISSAPELAAKTDNIKASKQQAEAADSNTGNLNQVFGYIEIPVEIKYNVADGKLGVNVVGGFSTLLLNKDEVFVQTNDLTQSLGASNNLRDVNFSGNIGLDVDYAIKKNLFINVSPMFKVQTNTFSKNSGSIQPYYLGIYTGLNYKF